MQKDIDESLKKEIGNHNQEELVNKTKRDFNKNITKPQRKLLAITGWSIISLLIMLMVAIYVSQTIDSAADKAADKVIEYIKSQEE